MELLKIYCIFLYYLKVFLFLYPVKWLFEERERAQWFMQHLLIKSYDQNLFDSYSQWSPSSKVGQNLALMIREKSMFGAPISYSNELHTLVSVAFSVLSSVQSEMAKIRAVFVISLRRNIILRNWPNDFNFPPHRLYWNKNLQIERFYACFLKRNKI